MGQSNAFICEYIIRICRDIFKLHNTQITMIYKHYDNKILGNRVGKCMKFRHNRLEFPFSVNEVYLC